MLDDPSALQVRRLVALLEQLQIEVPVVSVGFRDFSISPPLVAIKFSAGATQAQIAQAQSVVAAWDWGVAADETDSTSRARVLAKVRMTADDADSKRWKALALAVNDRLNALSQPAQRMTKATWISDLRSRIDAGQVDG